MKEINNLYRAIAKAYKAVAFSGFAYGEDYKSEYYNCPSACCKLNPLWPHPPDEPNECETLSMSDCDAKGWFYDANKICGPDEWSPNTPVGECNPVHRDWFICCKLPEGSDIDGRTCVGIGGTHEHNTCVCNALGGTELPYDTAGGCEGCDDDDDDGVADKDINVVIKTGI